MNPDHDQRLREHGTPIERDGTASDIDEEYRCGLDDEVVDILVFLATGVVFAILLFVLEAA